MTMENGGAQSDEQYYFIDSTRQYTRTQPHPTQNLIELYNLSGIANSVARVNADGTKGVKLRKSYKAHINDLPGKHSMIPKDRTISPIVFAPDREGGPIPINVFEPEMLNYNISFQRTPDTGIPGFDPANLAIGGDTGSQGTKRKSKGNGNDQDSKRRRVD